MQAGCLARQYSSSHHLQPWLQQLSHGVHLGAQGRVDQAETILKIAKVNDPDPIDLRYRGFKSVVSLLLDSVSKTVILPAAQKTWRSTDAFGDEHLPRAQRYFALHRMGMKERQVTMP